MTKLPPAFQPVRSLQTRRGGGRGKGSPCCIRRTKAGTCIHFSIEGLRNAHISVSKTYTVALLTNGMFAVLEDPKGYHLTSTNKEGTRMQIRIPGLFPSFKTMEGELKHEHWIFPVGTFKEPFNINPDDK